MYHTSGKIIFKRETGNGDKLVMTTTDEATWPELMDNFKFFLQGCGYILPENTCLCGVEIREDKEEEVEAVVEEHYTAGVPT